jgi:RNA polymerase sigma-70 factor (ECF subfamily)
MVFSVALKMLADEEEAKDIVQETFLRVWLNISKFDARRSFTTWLYAIASRLCLDHLKSRTHVVAMPEDESVLRRYASADGQLELENREWVAIVRLLAEGLSPKQRLVFTLSQLEGLSSEEVEETTGLTAKQVKSNLYVARQTIREHLKNMGYE